MTAIPNRLGLRVGRTIFIDHQVNLQSVTAKYGTSHSSDQLLLSPNPSFQKASYEWEYSRKKQVANPRGRTPKKINHSLATARLEICIEERLAVNLYVQRLIRDFHGWFVRHLDFNGFAHPNRFTNVKQDKNLCCKDSRQQKCIEGAEQREFKKRVIHSAIFTKNWIEVQAAVVCLRVRKKIATETWEQIKTAFASGMGLREIARNVGIPEGTVLARAKREGWTRQIEFAKALAKREDSLTATPVEAVAMSMQKRGERHVERMAGVSERGVDHVETMGGPEILNSVDQIEKLDKVARRTFGLKDDNPYSGFSLNVLNMGDLEVSVGDRKCD